ncbi:MAG: dihydroorotase [Bdellovibrio sp.]|nr:dihydroorotase [Bdellovibrio sp.]
MIERFIIRGGKIIDPTQDIDFIGDILVEDGKIKALEKPGKIPVSRGLKIIDAKKFWVLPGLIDVHVHLREPGFEYKETIETGTKAAVAGGFTSIACMANTLPVNDSPSITAYIREKARQSASCRVFPVGALSKGLKGEELAEIGGMIGEGAKAISDDGIPVMNSYLMRKGLDYARAFGVAIIDHAEDSSLVGQGVMNESIFSTELGLRGNPQASEEIMVARDIALCRLTKSRLHIAHISTAVALEHLKRAKDEGLLVTAEASPHHLTLTEEEIRNYDTNFKVAPPLRSKKDVLALRKALAQGYIDIIASDHAPHSVNEKALEFDQAANGIIGLQTTVPLTLGLVSEKILPLKRWIESLTIAPAKLLGIEYGTLKKGSQADITIIDPNEQWTFSEALNRSKSKNSPFFGRKFQGKVKMTIVGGHIVFEGGIVN